MPAGAKAARIAIGIHSQHGWVAIHQPFWRGCRGRTEDKFQSRRMQRLDRFIKPDPVIMSRFRLETRPGKLANAHMGNPKLGHLLRIDGPTLLWPMFRIIADTQTHYPVLSR